MQTNPIPRISIAVIAFLLPGLTHASGFRLPESSIAGLSLSNAVVANTDVIGAMIYNPALMSVQKDRRTATIGLMNVRLDMHVDPEIGNATDSTGDNSVDIPNFYYMSKPTAQWSWGLGFHAPFGLETKWPAGTFGLFNTLGVSGLEPEESKLEIVNLTPNVAYRINQNNSVSFGINYYKVRKLAFNTQSININANGNDLGYTLAYLYNDGPWSFGASYRTSVDVSMDGSITAGGTQGDASADVEFPSMLQIGIRNKINQRIALEFDIERTNWSSFDIIEIYHNHPAQSAPPPNTIPSPITSINNWDDVTAYRLGATYQLNSKLQLRFGYTLDNTPQPDKYFSARLPDADRHLFSIGAGYKSNDWEFEGGLMYIKFDDRTVNRPANSFLVNLGSGNTDPNGTDAYNGKYQIDAIIVGFGFTKMFTY